MLIQEPKNRIGERSAELEKLTTLFEQADTLLQLNLDPIMNLYQVTNKFLFNAYYNARSIDDTGAITAPDYIGNVPTSTILNIANIPYLASRSFKLKNTGTSDFTFCLATSNNTMEPSVVHVMAGATVSRQSDNLQEYATFLNIENVSTTLNASYEVRITE
jgi:hypothetical protein